MSLNDNKLRNSLEEETKCQICTGLIDDPHTLFCGHSFCGICCLNWFKTNKNCPTCRTAAVRQPVHSIALQKISDLLRPEGKIPERKLTRADWLDLYPIENQSTNYIRDVDQDGVIHRCSNCGWELDEEDFCVQCMIQFEGPDRLRHNGYDMSDTEENSHHSEDDEDLEDFVVDDNQVEFESSTHGDTILDDDISLLLDSDDEEEERLNPNRRKRRRIRHDSSEEESMVQAISSDSHQSDNSEEQDNDDNQNDNSEEQESDSDHYSSNSRRVISLDDEDEQDESEDESEEEEFVARVRNKYIDDYASEDDEEEESRPQPKPDHVRDTIARAQAKMERARASANSAIVSAANTLSRMGGDGGGGISSSSSSSDDSDDVEADYDL